MDTWVIVSLVLAVIVLVVAALGAWTYLQGRRTAQLRDMFGPEYDRVIKERGRAAGERELTNRRDRVKVFDVRPLTREQHASFTTRWIESQSHFVDDPSRAIEQAHLLVGEVMEARGYPAAEGFEQRAADVSVDHPDMVSNYRAAHEVSVRHEAGMATTEELRRAMVNYRALFADLLERDGSETGGGAQVPQPQPRG